MGGGERGGEGHDTAAEEPRQQLLGQLLLLHDVLWLPPLCLEQTLLNDLCSRVQFEGVLRCTNPQCQGIPTDNACQNSSEAHRPTATATTDVVGCVSGHQRVQSLLDLPALRSAASVCVTARTSHCSGAGLEASGRSWDAHSVKIEIQSTCCEGSRCHLLIATWRDFSVCLNSSASLGPCPSSQQHCPNSRFQSVHTQTETSACHVEPRLESCIHANAHPA